MPEPQPLWHPFVLDPSRQAQLRRYADLLRQFNRGVNLISREDEDAIEEHHLLHCLALTHKPFPAGSVLVDWGTGGGLPAVPLAIAFPDVTVHAVDAVGKKILAVQTMGRRLGLDNLSPWSGRAEVWPGAAHYSVSRATAPLLDLWGWHLHGRAPEAPPAAEGAWRPGLVCLKGGDLREEAAALLAAHPSLRIVTYDLSSLLGRPYFDDKYILEVFEEEPGDA